MLLRAIPILAFTLIKFKILISPVFPELGGLKVGYSVTLHSHFPASWAWRNKPQKTESRVSNRAESRWSGPAGAGWGTLQARKCYLIRLGSACPAPSNASLPPPPACEEQCWVCAPSREDGRLTPQGPRVPTGFPGRRLEATLEVRAAGYVISLWAFFTWWWGNRVMLWES